MVRVRSFHKRLIKLTTTSNIWKQLIQSIKSLRDKQTHRFQVSVKAPILNPISNQRQTIAQKLFRNQEQVFLMKEELWSRIR